MKSHEFLWGAAVVSFIAWVLLASSPAQRIDRACRPLHWASSGIVSLTALTAPKYETDAQDGGNKVVYGCEYSIWRLFYQKDYDKYLAAQRRRLLGPHSSPLRRCVRGAASAVKGTVHAGKAAGRASCAQPQPRPVGARPTAGGEK